MAEQHIIQPSGFVHSVFFWLKSAEHENVFLSHLHTFINASHFVQSKHIGLKHSSERDVVENTYDVCLTVTFDSKEQHDAYQSEPAHLKFVEDASHLWEKVSVYDSTSVF